MRTTKQAKPALDGHRLTEASQPAGAHQQQVDNSPRQLAQTQRLAQLQAAPVAKNETGLPDTLKQGIEALSGMDMSDVQVHANSVKPAQLNALAYAQGNDIHLAPGQEAHLPHEAWHVVQQRQGRVRPTLQMAGVGVNDDGGLEREADVMGARAVQLRVAPGSDATEALAGMGAPTTPARAMPVHAGERGLRSTALTSYRPVQRVIYKDKGKQPKNKFLNIRRSGFYKGLADTQEQAWAYALHGRTGEHYNTDEATAKIAELMASGDAPPPLPVARKGKKIKRLKPTVARVTGPATGTQVDYATDPRFRTERRVIRRLNKVGKSPGDKNIYVKRYKPRDKDTKPFKLVTSSLPPTSLPADYEDRDVDSLAASRLGQTLHSEGVTDKIEQNYGPFRKRKLAQEEAYSTSSREQCEVCRYHHVPHKPEAHVFGSLYSGTTDHIEDDALREKLVENQGIIGDLSLGESERRATAEARRDAAAARQYDPHQNPLLANKRSKLSHKDSDGEQSSDDDDLFVEEALDWGGTKGWGKGKVTRISRREYFPDEEFDAERLKTLALLAKKKNEADSGTDAEGGDEASSGEEEGD